MRYLKQFHSALLLFAILRPPTAQAADLSTQRPSLADELEATYPKPPKRLDTDPTTSSVLLIDIQLKGALGRVDGAALVALGSGGGPIRAAPLKGDLVMFHTLEPGTYSLRFIRVENYNPSPILALEKPPIPEINVTVARGGVYYLGTVVVSRKKITLFGLKPPEFQFTYDARRELEAWLAFKKKYADSPWTVLADRRILALRSPGRAQDTTIALAAPEGLIGQDSAKGAGAHAQTPSPTRDPVIHAACMLVHVDDFKEEGRDEQKAQLMTSLLCQIPSGVCQKEPRGEPCKNSIRRLNDDLAKSGQSLPTWPRLQEGQIW